MMRVVFLAILVAVSSLGSASAQQSVWIQVEAQPSLREATTRAQAYAGELPDVNGFALATGWYGIVLGPYAPADADRMLAQLRARRIVPSDSFIAYGNSFRRQFWPVGANTANAAPVTPDVGTPEAVAEAPAPAEPVIIPTEETVAEARANERLMSREEREALQIALQWEGFYNSNIDGAFGPGTRNAMAAWQEANNYEPTGVMTTKQRMDVIADYRGVLDALSLAPVTDDVAGITVDMPTGMVEFDRYEPPFAHYKSRDDSGVRLVLISQSGDSASLGGLYDIMQTLEIVPLNGERSLSRDSFVLTGANSSISTYAEARVVDGAIKGFALVWPAGDEKRRALAVEAMKASFTPIDGIVLPDAYGEAAMQSLDLLSGLQIRTPDATGSGFYVDGSGRVLTTAALVNSCSRITLDADHEATVTAKSGALALLTPTEALAPMGMARFKTGAPRLNSEVAVSGYSYGGRLTAPTLTYGTLAELQGLDGSSDVIRLAMAALPGDAGAPVYDTQGAVLGMLLPADDSARQMPEDVSFASDMQSIVAFLSDNGVETAAVDTAMVKDMAPEDLIRSATDMTVLVGCYND